MSLQEASSYFGDYRDLLQEVAQMELSENLETTIPHTEILACFDSSNDL